MLNLCSLALVAATASGVVNAVLHEKHPIPQGWLPDGVPAAEQAVKLELAMSPKNFDAMIDRLYEISDPAHKDYGKHMDRDELKAKIAPSAAEHAAVVQWLKKSGVKHFKSDGMNIDFVASIETANRMLNTKFAYYKKDGVRKLRTPEYHLPAHISSLVDIVTPTTYFGTTTPAAFGIKPKIIGSPEANGPLASSACATFITPGCVKQLYNIGQYTADPSFGSNVGFGSFLNQSASYSDLSAFEGFFDIPAQSFPVQTIHGGVNNQSAAVANVGEANLDVQNIVGASHPLPVREFITGGSPPIIFDVTEPAAGGNENEPYFAYFKYLLGQTNANLPQVISNSYGDVEETVPPKYARAVCNQIAQIGMRGISVLESSGDLGVGAGCKSNVDGSPRFEPIFPATCPFVTAIGGTQAVNPEVAWVGSSGGFSNYFARPAYQNGAVITYLQRYISPATLSYFQPFFNQSGRGFPDVSAHSLTPNYLVVYGGKLAQSGGTSAAAPVVAAIVGLLNDARLRKGQSPLGFLNPFLYSQGTKGLFDITGGGSNGCNGVNGQTGQPVNGSDVIKYASWNATVGWDPVTGLGTPDFGALLAIVTNSTS